jgi:hypothetical protein
MRHNRHLVHDGRVGQRDAVHVHGDHDEHRLAVQVSDPSPAVTPVIALSLKVKAKKASYRPGRWGTRTLVSWAKKPSKANRMVTRTCTNASGIASSKLCKFTVYKSGKVKVRTKGYRNVVITVSIVATPKASAGPTYGPSPTWTRTWNVR